MYKTCTCINFKMAYGIEKKGYVNCSVSSGGYFKIEIINI